MNQSQAQWSCDRCVIGASHGFRIQQAINSIAAVPVSALGEACADNFFLAYAVLQPVHSSSIAIYLLPAICFQNQVRCCVARSVRASGGLLGPANDFKS